MPGNFERPTGSAFADFLSKTLGPDYNVNYIERRDYRGDVDPSISFFNISQKKGQTFLSTNLKINLGMPSRFRTDYGGGAGKTPEYAPEILTRRGSSGYTVGATWESTYVPVQAPGQKPGARIDDYTIQHQLYSPTESLANLIRVGFDETRYAARQGSTDINVQSRIFNLLAEGSGERANYSVPAGALLMMPQDRPATRRKAATSIQLVDVYNQNVGVSPLEQRRRMLEGRIRTIEREEPIGPSGSGPGISQLFKAAGYAPDRDNASRFVSYANAARRVINQLTGMSETEVYLPTEKIAKHRTIVDTGRQLVGLLDASMQEIVPSNIPTRGSTSGYRYSTADVGGRIPSQSLMLGTLFSSQYPVPGAGMYFPETTGLNIASAGYYKEPSFPLTENVSDLLAGKSAIQLGQQGGAIVPSKTKWTYARMKTPESDEFIDLQQRMGSHSFAISGQQLRIPRYYDPVSGQGIAYDPSGPGGRPRGTAVTPQQIQQLSARVGAPVITDETAERVYLEMSGYSQVGAKFAISGVKTDIVPYEGSPSFSAGGRTLPISALTWEGKSMPETFITSLGALAPQTQTRMLASYTRSLRQEIAGMGDTEQRMQMQTRYRGVLAGLQELAAVRQQDPGARMDIDILSKYADTPAHELGRDILQRVILGGKTTEQFAQLSERELGEFAQSPLNTRNLARYGIGYVSRDMTDPISVEMNESNVRAWREAYIAQRGSDKGFERAFGFSRKPVDGRRMMTFRPEGFYMPAVAGPAVEFAGGGTLGVEEINILNKLAPSYANRLGVSLKDITSGGALSRNIRNPVRWAQAQIAQLSMIEGSRSPSAINIPTALSVTEQMASQMLADPEMMRVLGKEGGNLGGLQQFQELFKGYFPDVKEDEVLRRPVQFSPALGHYIPSTAAIRTLAEEDIATITEGVGTGEDQTRIWNMYQRSFHQGLLGAARQDVGTITKGTGRMTNYFMEMFGLPGGEKRASVKGLLKSDVGVTTARYAFWGDLEQNEVYGTKQLYETAIRNELTSQGVEPTPEEVEQTYRMISGLPSSVGDVPEYVREQGLPGFGARYPIIAGEESLTGMNLLTPEHMKRMGRAMPADEASGLSNLHWRMGLGMSTIFQGDFDLDMLMANMGLRARRGEEGGLQVGLAGFDKRGAIDPDLERSIQSMRGASYTDIQKSLFPALSQQREFDPLLQGLIDRGPGGLRGVAGNLMNTQFGKAGYKAYSVLADSLRNYSGAKAQMGITYDFTRMLEAASEVGGWSPIETMRARRGRASLYQPFLDVSSGVPYPIVNMFQTSYLAEGAGGNLGLGWGMPIRKVGDPVQFMPDSARMSRLNAGNAFGLVQRMASTAIQPYDRKGVTELPSPDVLAWAFSPEGSRAFEKFSPESVSASQKVEQDRLYNEMIAAQSGAGDPNRLAIQNAYYQQTSLQGALQRPWGDESLSVNERALGMRTALTDWMRANYTGREEQVFAAPLIQGMFSKSLASKVRKEPDWAPPASFAPTIEGQRLLTRAAQVNPLFGLMRGRLAPADSAMRYMRSLQGQQGPLGSLSNWALGAIQETLGFGRTRMETEMGSMYEELMASPIQIRASNLPGIAGVGPRYSTQTTTGKVKPAQYGEQALRTAGAYMMARTLGIPGERTYDFTGALFPVSDTARARMRAGDVMEARLGDIMGQGEGWFTVNRKRINPRTGALEGIEEGDPTQPFQGAFSYQGYLDDQYVEVGATPDFARLYQNAEGEDVLQFIEQKTPGATKTREHIAETDLPGWALQSRVTPWVVQKLREQIQAGMRNLGVPQSSFVSQLEESSVASRSSKAAALSLRSSLASLFPDDRSLATRPDEQLSNRAYEAVMAGRFESTVFVTQEGSKIGEEIASGRGTPERIEAELLAQSKQGYWGEGAPQVLYQPSPTGDDATMQGMTQTIGDAARSVAAARPNVFRQLWEMVQAGPEYWKQRRTEARAANKSTGRATAAIDLLQQVRLQSRAIGRGAELAGAGATPAAANVSQRNFQTVAQYAEQTAGPAMRRYIEQAQNTPTTQEFDTQFQTIQQIMLARAQAGETVEFGVPPGVEIGTLGAMVTETAEGLGYQASISQFEDLSGIQASFRTPPSTGRELWENDPIWQSLNTAYGQAGLAMNQMPIGERGGALPRIERISGLMSRRVEQLQRRAQAPPPPVQTIPTPAQAAQAAPSSTGGTPQTVGGPTGGGGGAVPPTGGGAVPPVAGGAGTVPPFTGQTPPTPPPSPGASTGPGGPYDAAAGAKAEQLIEFWGQYKGYLQNQASAMRGQIGAGILGVGSVLATMPTEQIKEQLGPYATAGAAAAHMYKIGTDVRRAWAGNRIDPRILAKADIPGMAEQVISTGMPLGDDLADLMSVFKFGFKEDKPGTQKAEPSEATMTYHFERLAQVSERLTKNFEDLSANQKDYNQYVAEAAKLGGLQKLEEASQKVSQAAAPLTAAGVLEEVAPGQYRPIPGAAPTGTAQQQQMLAYQKAVQGQQEAAVDMEQIGVSPEGKGLGGMMRRMFGGFGMMYMRSILNFATQGLGVGAAERAGMEGVFAQTAGGLSGYAKMPYNQAVRTQNQMALAGAEVQGMPALMAYMQTTPGVRDIYSTATAGLGAFAFASWAGGMMEGGKDSWLSQASPAIGLGIAGISLVAEAAQKSKDIEGLGYRYAMNRGPGQAVSVTDAFGSLFAGIGETRDVSDKYRDIAANLNLDPSSLAQLLGGGTREGEANTYVRTLRILQGQNLNLPSDAVAQAFQFAQMSGVPSNRTGEIAANITQTGYTPGILQGVLSAAGRGRAGVGQGYLQTMGNVDLGQAMMLQAGQGMLQNLGTAAPFITQGMSTDNLLRFTQNLGGLQGTLQGDIYARQVAQWQQQRQFGWNVHQPQLPGESDIPTQAELGLEQLREQLRQGEIDATGQMGALLTGYLGYNDIEAQKRQTEMRDRPLQAIEYENQQIEQVARMGAIQRGLLPGRSEAYYTDYMRQAEAMTPRERTLQEAAQGQLGGAAQYLMLQGYSETAAASMIEGMQGRRTPIEIGRYTQQLEIAGTIAEQFGQNWQLPESARITALQGMDIQARQGRFTPFMQSMYSGVSKFDPYSMTQAYAYGNNVPGIGALPDFMVSRDIWGPTAPDFLQGMPLNAPAFTVSGASHPMWKYLQANMGGDFNWQGGVGKAFREGFTVPGTNITAAGITGAQNYMMSQQAENQAAYAGIAQQQLALQMKYVPQFWAIQDQQRALGIEQQQWSFGRSLEGLQIQQTQFFQNQGLQQRQTQLQRGWTRQDWGVQDETRAMQWAWRQSDFQEQARFLTGRERRVAERSMERETIMYGREGEQIDTQRQRQEEMWALEDERFDMQKQQFMENQKFQEEGIEKQRQFFEERTELEDQLIALQREYQEAQWEIQQQSIGLQAKQAADAADYAELQAGISLTMMERATLEEQIQKNGVSFVELLDDKLKEWVKLLGGKPAGSGGGSQTSPGELGHPELTNILLDNIAPGDVRASFNAWNTEVVQGRRPEPEGQTIDLALYIGDEYLGNFIINTVDREVRL